MSRPYRLTLVSDAREVGGAERFLAYLLQALPPGPVPAVLARDPAVLALLLAARPGTPGTLVGAERGAAWRALRAQRPDVVHLNLPAFTSCRAEAVAALGQRLPVVLVDHLPAPGLTWRGRAVQRLLTRRAAARVAVGVQAARAVERLGGLPPGAVRTIRNGVPRPPAAVPPPDGARPVVGVLGRLTRQKGLDVLLPALAALPEVDLVVMGDGPERAALERLADALGLRPRVRFLGASPDPEPFWAQVDVLAVPSRSEALPLVVLEALHRGRPVVASRVGSVDEAVTDEVGRLVAPEDPAALTAALREVCLDPALRRRLGGAALSAAGACWSSEVMARAYDAVYREALR